MKYNRNISIDFYRGIFAIFVALGHYFYWLGDSDKFPHSFILSVDFFFILSGYVLTIPILESNKRFKCYFFNFVIRRVCRIFPVYVFLIIPLLVGVIIIKGQTPYFIDVMIAIGLLHTFPIDSLSGFDLPLGIAWSISVEFWIGIIYFPLVFYFKNNKIFYMVLMLCILLLYFILIRYSTNFMDVHYDRVNDFFQFSTVRGLIGFSIGTLVAYTLKNTSFKNEIFHSFVQVLLFFVFIIYYLNTGYDRYYEYLALPLFGIFIFSIGSKLGVFYNLFNNYLGVLVGNLSYGLYLSHPIVIQLIKQKLLSHNIIIYLSVCLLISYFLHRYIEAPFIKLGRSITMRE